MANAQNPKTKSEAPPVPKKEQGGLTLSNPGTDANNINKTPTPTELPCGGATTRIDY